MNETMAPVAVAALAFATVFVALGIVALLIFALRAAARRAATQAAANAAGDAAASADLDPELLAVLTAAASEAIGARLRVHRVHVHPEQAERSWQRAGRMDIMISHRVGPSR